MQGLTLNNNQFVGELPACIGTLKRLKKLNVQYRVNSRLG